MKFRIYQIMIFVKKCMDGYVLLIKIKKKFYYNTFDELYKV